MQMFGVGIMELMVILILIVIVVGPDRMPQVASDLAKWIRQTRAYAKHLMGDFNEVVSELEKEAGASREDWKEIASVITRHTGAVGHELNKFGRDVEESSDIEEIKQDPQAAPAGNGKQDSTARKNGNGAVTHDAEEASEAPETETADEVPEEEKPWYVPERATRRRSSE